MINVFIAPDRLQGLGFSLPWVYVAWIVVLALLYPLCRYWQGLKARRRDWWLSYL
jgi:protein-S-isoprenylcysteine O-methyltransferase Ste14